jgi:small subunit ribosomal protein S5
MSEESKTKQQEEAPAKKQVNAEGKEVVEKKAPPKKNFSKSKNFKKDKRGAKGKDEFEQQILDVARVTRVMAGGKRMNFRVCIAIGDRKGRVAIGLKKGADISIAINKAVNQAKKNLINVPIVNETIPHGIKQKYGAAEILFKPASQGRGILAGGIVRIILDLAGIKNISSKILGTNNKVNNAKCTIEALSNLKQVSGKQNKQDEKPAKEAHKDKKEDAAAKNNDKANKEEKK